MLFDGVDNDSEVKWMVRGTMTESAAGATRGSTGATRGSLSTAHGGSVRLTARGRSLLPRRDTHAAVNECFVGSPRVGAPASRVAGVLRRRRGGSHGAHHLLHEAAQMLDFGAKRVYLVVGRVHAAVRPL